MHTGKVIGAFKNYKDNPKQMEEILVTNASQKIS